jgi:uncharacterized membrane protein
MIKKNLFCFAALIIWLLPVLYFLKIYNSIPQTVPVHFGLDGTADRYGSKQELIWMFIILSAVTIGIYFLITNLPRIDPKKTAGYSAATFKKLALTLVIFLSALQLFIIDATLSGSFTMSKFILPLLGLLFAFLGNLMHSVKPNYFFGVRTPWSLENENNWRATHQLASKLWLAGGIAITITTLLFPYKTGFIILICIVTVITLIPVIFSYQYYKKHKK